MKSAIKGKGLFQALKARVRASGYALNEVKSQCRLGAEHMVQLLLKGSLELLC